MRCESVGVDSSLDLGPRQRLYKREDLLLRSREPTGMLCDGVPWDCVANIDRPVLAWGLALLFGDGEWYFVLIGTRCHGSWPCC